MDAAIRTSLMGRTGLSLLLRETQGPMTSVLSLMDLTISAPDHTTVSRRAVALPLIQPASMPHGPLHVLIDSTGLQIHGAGQWLEVRHGAKSRQKARKLRLAVDVATGIIVAQTLTNQDADDPFQVAPLLDPLKTANHKSTLKVQTRRTAMAKLDKEDRDKLTDRQYAFPKQRKEPLEDASHVRNAVARFDQVHGVTDAERDEAWKRIETAAKKFGVDLNERSWRELKKPAAE